MKKKRLLTIQMDDQGNLVLPQELINEYGLVPGSLVRLEQAEQGFSISRSTASLARVYVEPTNACNLTCRTCIRNVWDEPLGRMQKDTYASILEGMKSFSPIPEIFLGGLGEPLSHPDILDMISAAREMGAEVELITNGILLTEEMAKRLVELGLSRLWVSIDGATPASYADVRLGDALPQVISNLTRLQTMRYWGRLNRPKIGIAFVAMKRNITDLPEVIRIGKQLGADKFSISNVLPHNEELKEEVLYNQSMYFNFLQPSQWTPEITFPRMDLNETIIKSMADVLKWRNGLRIARQSLQMGADSCPFLERGSISIRWDGEVSPCLALLHTHKSYLEDNLRTTYAYFIGNIRQRSLADLWNDPQYLQLRERLQAYDFSPCTFCNSCEMAEANMEDCFGNTQPGCGGCLWAQGFIQCP